MIALLIAMSAIGPVSLNILMPAAPALVVTFATDPGTVQLTLSLFLLGLAAAQLVFGALSDRFGRRPVVLFGLTLTVLSSLGAMLATSIAGLIVARTIQSFGASTGLAIGRAIIRDLYDRDRAASMIGWVTMAMVVAPMVAPLMGGLLYGAFGWPAIFGFLALASALVLVWVVLALPETRRASIGGASLAGSLHEARLLLGSTAFAGYALAAALSSAMFFAFVGGAPHVMVAIMGRPPAEYGAWFMIAAFGYMVGNYITARWSTRFGINRMIVAGAVVSLAGSLAQVGLIKVISAGTVAALFLPQSLISLGSGMLLPNAIAGAVSVRPQSAGTASGITGFLQMGLGAVVAQLIAHMLGGADSALPLVLMVLGFGIATLAAFVALVRGT